MNLQKSMAKFETFKTLKYAVGKQILLFVNNYTYYKIICIYRVNRKIIIKKV